MNCSSASNTPSTRKLCEASGWPSSSKSMALKSVYLPKPHIDNNHIHIKDDEHRHLAVARAEAGEMVEVFDGCGAVWMTIVESMGRRETVVAIQSSRQVERPKHEIILGLALIRTAAFEGALEKAVEVGITRI